MSACWGDLYNAIEYRQAENMRREKCGLDCVKEYVRLMGEYSYIADTFKEEEHKVLRIDELQRELNLLQDAIRNEKAILHDLLQLNRYKMELSK